MNLKELGALVKNKRESKNLTLEDVAKAIKIPMRSLVAIEDGDLDVIGYETYYKNFLKCYMLFIGFSYDEYQEFLEKTEEFNTQAEPPKSLEAQHAETQPEMTKPKGKKLFVQLFVLAVIGGTAYFYFTQEQRLKDIAVSEVKIVEEVKTETVEPAPVEQKANEPEVKAITEEKVVAKENATKENVESSEVAKNTEEKAKVTENSEEVAIEKVQEIKTPELVEQKIQEPKEKKFDIVTFIKENPSAKVIDWASLSTPKKGEQQVVLYANQDCWMQYEQDGNKSHFILKKGTQREFIFKKEMKFRIANGSAITMFHNKKLVEVGDSSKMREVVLK